MPAVLGAFAAELRDLGLEELDAHVRMTGCPMVVRARADEPVVDDPSEEAVP